MGSSRSAEERLKMRSTTQRTNYQTAQLDRQAAFDASPPPLTAAGYEADSGQTIVTADGSEIRVNVNTNGAIEQGASVTGTLLGGIDARPRPRTATARRGSAPSAIVASLYQAQTAFAGDNYPLGNAYSRFYLKVNNRVVDLGQYPGSIGSEQSIAATGDSDGADSILPPVVRIVRRPQAAVIVQLATIDHYTHTFANHAIEYRVGDLVLHTWIVSPDGRIIAQDHQTVTPAVLFESGLSAPWHSALNLSGYLLSPLAYPAALTPWRSNLVTSEAVAFGEHTAYRFVAPENSTGSLHDPAVEDPLGAWGYFVNWAKTTGDRIIRIRATRSLDRFSLFGRGDLSLSDLYASDARSIEIQVATATTLNAAMIASNFEEYDQAFRRVLTRPLRSNFFTDFPVFAEWGIDENTLVSNTWHFSQPSYRLHSVREVLDATAEQAYLENRRTLLFVDDFVPGGDREVVYRNLPRRFRLLSAAAIV